MQFIEKSKVDECSLCPICSGESDIIDIVKTINPDAMDNCNLRRCHNCSHWWIDPMPRQQYLSHLYADNSEFVVNKGYAEEQVEKEVNYKSIEDYFTKITHAMKQLDNFNYLEVGSGNGHLLNYMSRKANLCYGVEPGCWKKANSRANVVSDINDIPKGIFFDLIMIQDVLEHLADPIHMLTKLRSMANDDCLITGGFPNSESPQAQQLKGKWAMVRPLGHLHFFSSDSVIKALNKSNWRIISLRNCSAPHLADEWINKDQWSFQARSAGGLFEVSHFRS
ncbi:MAG: hypothetical protein CVU71_15335 [Deltaproteobacteria bacterium HGW-Deltaproteobacteria-6]|jgi:2-polyprenyl-3-methyl-5-hydroxy-6-metoxy-1,4-benzoquinol methylase|nr:MAG: hypothetical protein CVU71_15335 [Deltaproteobacteria bacterium HGW-Deltaproteobacteria-6]